MSEKPKLQSTGVQVLIQPDKPLEKINGIFIPEKARKPTNSGIIQSIAKECDFLAGDMVCFNYNQGYEVEYDNITYLSINYLYILAKKTDTTMQPMNDYVFVELIKEESRVSEKGLLLGEDPNVSKAKVLHASKQKEPVLYNGEMILHDKVNLITDDVILYHKGRGIPYEKGLFLSQSDVISIID